jgi:transcriptional regulator with GAF, ATPase, and Fis domain
VIGLIAPLIHKVHAVDRRAAPRTKTPDIPASNSGRVRPQAAWRRKSGTAQRAGQAAPWRPLQRRVNPRILLLASTLRRRRREVPVNDPEIATSGLSHPPIESTFSIDSIVVGRSPRMRAVFDFVRVIADSESNVLIVGETGTGKEMIARLIHHTSRRRRRPFVAVSCAILTETLIESELFGHERGAFTGAIKDRPGRFELAEGGTIFLDDIDDVPPAVQVKLLRVLQNRTVERVGGTRSIPIDVRVITGSKRSLQQLAEDGRFREDLFYRLNVVPIWLPPLRERREDISLLTDHFLRRFFRERGDDAPELTETVRSAFLQYPWPGNVRELENACERIAQTCTCNTIRIGCVPASVLLHTRLQSVPVPVTTTTCNSGVSLDDRLEEVETQLITWALRTSHGNKSKAAELLQIKRSTLGDRIRKLHLDHLGRDD